MSNVQEALKAAIEELETLQRVFEQDNSVSVIEQCKAAIAEIEKCEPVGYLPKSYELNILANSNDYPLGMIYSIKKKDDDLAVYTSPQPRDWVGLSEDEIVKIMDGTEFNEDNFCILEAAINYCRAIESALKQINIKG